MAKLGCASPDYPDNNNTYLTASNVSSCNLVNEGCQYWETNNCHWNGCDPMTDSQRLTLCQQQYPDISTIAAFGNVRPTPCSHLGSGWVNPDTDRVTTCYDSMDRDPSQCCITQQPRVLGGILMLPGQTGNESSALALSSCDPTLLPPEYEGGGCNQTFINSKKCPYNLTDLYKRLKKYNTSGTYQSGGGGTINGLVDINDSCGKWLDALAKSTTEETSDIVNKLIGNSCSVAELGAESAETLNNQGTCREWCRQHLGYCDTNAVTYCTQQISSTCANLSNDQCIAVLDPFCSCIYWSVNGGMAQPQCFSSSCQLGRNGLIGYKTVSMDTKGAACGQFCQDAINILGNDINAGNLSQTCNISSTDNTNNTTTTTSTPISPPVPDTGSKTGIIIGVIIFIVFIIFIVIMVIMSGGEDNGERRRSKISKLKFY